VVLLVGGAVTWAELGANHKTSSATGSPTPSTAKSSTATVVPGTTAVAAPPSGALTRCQWDARTEPAPTVTDVGTPPTSVPAFGTQTMTITTNLGVLEVAVATAKAPCTAASFTYLAGKRFYDNSACHRLTTSAIFVLQCGDPSGTGTGGPAYQFADENLPIGKRPNYPRGVLAMANAGPGTNGSQFFIVYRDLDSTVLTANYTIVGTVTRGMDIVDTVAAGGVTPVADYPGGAGDGTPKTPVTITSMTVGPPIR